MKVRVASSPCWFLYSARIDRHESLGKRPLGEDPPQQVGQLEGDEKGVGGEAGTEDPRQDGIADEAEDPRQHGDGTHRRQ